MHPDYATGLNNLAALYQAQGDHARAELLQLQAAEIIGQHLERTASAQSEHQQFAARLAARVFLDNYLSLTTVASLSPDAAYRFTARWKGWVQGRQRELRAVQDEPTLAPLWQDLSSTTTRLATLSLAVPDPKLRDVWLRQLEELTLKKERLETELAEKSETFRRERALSTLTPDAIQQALPPNAVLIDVLEYTHGTPPTPRVATPAGESEAGQAQPETPPEWQYERRYLAFIVRPGKPIVSVPLGPVSELAPPIDTWWRTYGMGEKGKEAAKTLRSLVWQPLEPYLTDEDLVLWSPDSALAWLPLGALPGSRPSSYLIEERGIVTIPSPRTLVEMGMEQKAAASTPTLLALGNVNYNAEPGRAAEAATNRSGTQRASTDRLQFRRLKNTRAEVKSVRASFLAAFPEAKVELFKGGGCHRAARARGSWGRRYVHLATHGFFAPQELSALQQASRPGPTAGWLERPAGKGLFDRAGVVGFNPGLLSGLALAGANRAPAAELDDGMLTAIEVSGLDLRGADVVVLSACETGLGAEAAGEGLLGLQRAFHLGGARTVVASLWR